MTNFTKMSVAVQICCALICFTTLSVDCARMERYERNNMDSYHDPGPMNPTDEEKLAKLYGRDVVESHRPDFEQAREMGEQLEPIYHPRPAPIEMDQHFRQTQIDDTENLQNQPLTPKVVKKLLHDLLDRLESLEAGEQNFENVHSPVYGSRCSLHGLWISAVTGVAFHLQPFHDNGVHNTLHVQIVDSGEHHSDTQFLAGQWSGTAQVSAESPTTISIILQEKMMHEYYEPKTAVFVGQCVVCTGSPTIQGTWVLFPKNQVCFQETRPPRSDVMYLLAV